VGKTENSLFALGTILAGIGAVAGLIMLARGREKEVIPFAIAATVTTTVIGAARVLGGQTPIARP
jgi:hypothetical protein